MLDAAAIGRLVADPTMRKVTKNDKEDNVCEFRLACQQRKDKPSFINVTAWQGMGDFIFKNCRKGQKIYVSGTLTIPPFDKEKRRAYDPYVCVREFEFCDSKPKKPEQAKVEEKEPAPTDSTGNNQTDTISESDLAE